MCNFPFCSELTLRMSLVCPHLSVPFLRLLSETFNCSFKNELMFIKIPDQSTVYSEKLSKIENSVFCSSLNIFWWDVNLQVCRWCLLILCWITEEQIKVSESQSGWGWKGHLEVSFKQDHLEPISLAHFHMTFEYLQGWKLHNHSGQPVSVLGHQQSKKVLPDVQTEPPVFHFVLSLVLSLGITEKGLMLCSLYQHFKNLRISMSSPQPSPLWAAQAQPSGLSLYDWGSSPSIIVALFWTLSIMSMSVVLGRPKLDPALQV